MENASSKSEPTRMMGQRPPQLCLRCKIELHYVGRRAFHAPGMWGAHSYINELCSREKFDVYACNQCGSISLFFLKRES